MTETTLAIFTASLLGSPHCLAMCGPFVAFYSGAAVEQSAPGRPRMAHAAYNGGRLLAYLALGSVAGSLGSALDLVGTSAGLGRLAGLVSGILLLSWGIATLSALYGVRIALLHPPRWMQRSAGRVVHAVRGYPSVVRGGVTGLATALLPCGWLYVFVAAAAATGSPLRGASSMLIFWIGTLPLMISAGLGLQRLTGPLRSRLPAFTAIAMVILGLLTMAGRFRSSHGVVHQHRVPVATGQGP